MERKLATVLFADLVDSTALVSGQDPEVVRRRVTRFFSEVASFVQSHGGLVEKFAGDAVMAAFGVALAHEDDADRAIRAALAVQDAVQELELQVRIGIEAGEVVVEDGESSFATGEAVNVAARLQQAAEPGEILIGPVARRLALDCMDLEPAGTLELRGLERPVAAWRVLGASGTSRELRSLRAPLVGRDEELELLRNTFSRAVSSGRAHLFTIFGEPGVGKSRVAREFVDGTEDATVLAGRCLPYGEGVTYWPLAEMVKTVAGISDDDPIEEAFEKLRACCEDEAVADLLGLASGVLEAVHGDRSQQEIAWAARAFVEKLAEPQPVILAFEDIHWAEEPLIELIEHLADRVRGRVLIICLARAELLELVPEWGGGRLRSTAIELQPLGSEESAELVEALLAEEGAPFAPDVRDALLQKTEGNPLFVEETVRMLVERSGQGAIERIPDTVQALIGARIDRLPREARSLLRRAAVIGRVFWGGALAHLAPELEPLDEAVDDLVLRDLVVSLPRSSITGEDAFRFKHVLIREVAYAGLSKSARAEYHARFADWLRERAGDELLEIRGYHLDQAVTLLSELDGKAPEELVQEAAAALAKAGRRALAREANHSARRLLVRAVELEPTLERRYDAARAARRLAELPVVSREMGAVAEEAAAAGEREIEGKALTALAEAVLLRDADLPRAKELAERALEVLEPDQQFDALLVRARIARWEGAIDDQEHYVEDALEVAERRERKDLEATARRELASAYAVQLRHEEAQAMADRALELADESGSIIARAQALLELGHLQMHRGEVDAAEVSFEQARSLFSDAGGGWQLGRSLNALAWVAERRGDYPRAERFLREAIKVLRPLEDRGTLCESQRALADALTAQGKLDEAERVALEAMDTVGPHDASSQATTRLSLGLVRTAQGRDSEAEELFRDALRRLEGTGFQEIEVWILRTLDRFLRERDRPDPAVAERLAELAPEVAPEVERAAALASTERMT